MYLHSGEKERQQKSETRQCQHRWKENERPGEGRRRVCAGGEGAGREVYGQQPGGFVHSVQWLDEWGGGVGEHRVCVEHKLECFVRLYVCVATPLERVVLAPRCQRDGWREETDTPLGVPRKDARATRQVAATRIIKTSASAFLAQFGERAWEVVHPTGAPYCSAKSSLISEA